MENSPNEFESDLGYLEPKRTKKKAFNIFIFLFLGFFIYYFLFSPPSDFPSNAVIKIEKGESLRSVSALLKKEHIIRSRVVFESFVIIFGGELHIKFADYLFDKKIPVWRVAWRIKEGDRNMAPVSVTIPEGFDRNEIADTFAKELSSFSKINFLNETKDKEGYLFPDTYFFLSDANEKDVIELMLGNFDKKITPILPEIKKSGKSEKDIITMASVIEKEAKGDADREIISGILWRRIAIGMPLQVDAAMETYKTKGLPKNPISNPGLESIKASIYPKKSSYLYYLHDKGGNIHYAKTFAEHRSNILKYLK
jgi:UPF0755 protein